MNKAVNQFYLCFATKKTFFFWHPVNVFSYQQKVYFQPFSSQTAQRTGWTHYDVKKVESVSDHMYRMSMMTMFLDSTDIDRTRSV